MLALSRLSPPAEELSLGQATSPACKDNILVRKGAGEKKDSHILRMDVFQQTLLQMGPHV
ncbi:hypothetical protein H1R20_g11706, partial [Candolleomyces eurysporus]